MSTRSGGRRDGTFSPPLTSIGSYSGANTSRTNIVSRLSIEGKVKGEGQDAAVKLYMKFSIPFDFTPGSTIPLFSEENVKVRDFAVHPLDSDSVPYNFSSTTNPLLHKCARSLNLHSRSSKSYLSLFSDELSRSSSSRSSTANGSVVPHLEKKYLGYFVVSEYNVCFVLPMEFPPAPTSTDSDIPSKASKSRRRMSVSGRSSMHFMAALVLSVPLSSKPPRSPFMLSVPIPRCLSNTIKLHLFPPNVVSKSFQSLSSDEEGGNWDLATEPHVNRSSLKNSSRSNAYNDFADDESSETSFIGHGESCVINGTFTSTDHIRIRWASPMSSVEFPSQSDGRRRVGVKEVLGNITCTLMDIIDSSSVKLRIDYTGTCTGVWFPGVATMLGMDVTFSMPGCIVSWPDDGERTWKVEGDDALTGFAIGKQHDGLASVPSLEFPTIPSRNSSNAPSQSGEDNRTPGPSRTSSGSSASLLRVAPPQQLPNDVSFDVPPTPSTSGLPSSVTSFTQSSLAQSLVSELERNSTAPTIPITLHINMSKLGPPSKNKFTFHISGCIIVSQPMDDSSRSPTGSMSLPHPIFAVLTADKSQNRLESRSLCQGQELTTLTPETSLRASHLSDSGMKNSSRQSSPESKKRLESSEMIVRRSVSEVSVKSEKRDDSSQIQRTVSPQSLTPVGIPASQPKDRVRNGPLVIPWVKAAAVPLNDGSEGNWAYAVTMALPTPVDTSSDWFEFGIPGGVIDSPSGHSEEFPAIDVVCASVDGVPRRFEIFRQPQNTGNNYGIELSEKQDQRTWIRINVGEGADLRVVYTVKGQFAVNQTKKKIKECPRNVELLLPVFTIPVAEAEVAYKSQTLLHLQGLEDSAEHSYVAHEINVQPFKSINKRIQFIRPPSETTGSITSFLFRLLGILGSSIPLLLSLLLFAQLAAIRRDQQEFYSIYRTSIPMRLGSEGIIHTVTVTSTIHAAPTRSSLEEWPTETFTPTPSTSIQDTSWGADHPSYTTTSDYAYDYHANNDYAEHTDVSIYRALNDMLPSSAVIASSLQALFLQYRIYYEFAKEKTIWGWERVRTFLSVVQFVVNYPNNE